MATIENNTAWDEIFDPVVDCFTPEVARQILALRANTKLQVQLDELARKANEGELTDEERQRYEAYVDAIDLVAILQAKARKALSSNAAS